MDIDELTKAALRGSTPAQTILGVSYLDGLGVARDYGVALKWLSSAAAKGAPRAMLHLGRIHEQGLSIPPDIRMAVKLYSNAAERGEWLAHIHLARIYAEGRAAPADPGAALSHYRSAVACAGSVPDCPELQEALACIQMHEHPPKAQDPDGP